MIHILDSDGFEEITQLEGHKKEITDIEFIEDQYLSSAGADENIIIWDLPSEKVINQWKASSRWLRDISISSDRSELISCGNDGKLRFWKISYLNTPKKLDTKKVCKTWLISCDQRDPDLYVTCGHHRKVNLFFPHGQYVYKTKYYINRVAFIPDTEEIRLVIATNGDGLSIIKVEDMDLVTKRRVLHFSG